MQQKKQTKPSIYVFIILKKMPSCEVIFIVRDIHCGFHTLLKFRGILAVVNSNSHHHDPSGSPLATFGLPA